MSAPIFYFTGNQTFSGLVIQERFGKLLYFTFDFMKKIFVNLLVLLVALLIIGSMFLAFQARSQNSLKAEAAILGEKVAFLHETIAKRKLLQENALKFPKNSLEQIRDIGRKIRALDEELVLAVTETEKDIFASPSLVARLSVLPKFAELLYVMDQKVKAEDFLTQGEEQIQKIEEIDVRTSIYVCFAEADLQCRNFDGYERCRKAAEELVETSDDSKWKGEMRNTIENLKMLEREMRAIRPKAWLPITEDLLFGISMPRNNQKMPNEETKSENIPQENFHVHPPEIPLTLE